MKRFLSILLTVLMVFGSVLPVFATDAAAESTTLAPLGQSLPEAFADAATINFIDFAEANAAAGLVETYKDENGATVLGDYTLYPTSYGPSVGVFGGAQYKATFTVETAGDYEFIFKNYVRGEAWDGHPHSGTVQIDDGTIYTITDQAYVDAGYAKQEYGMSYFQGPTVTLLPGEHTITISGTRPNGLNAYFGSASYVFAGRSDVTAENPFAAYYSVTTSVLRDASNTSLNESAGGQTWYGFAPRETTAGVGGVRPQNDYAFKFEIVAPYDGVYDIALLADHFSKGNFALTLNGKTYTVYGTQDDGAFYYLIDEDVALAAGTYEGTVARINGAGMPLINSVILGTETFDDISGVTTVNPYTDASAYHGYTEVNFYSQATVNGNAATSEDGNTRHFFSWNPGDYSPAIQSGKHGIWITKAGYTFTLKFTPEESGSYDLALYLANITEKNNGYLNATTTYNLSLETEDAVYGQYFVKELPVEANSKRYYQFADNVYLEGGVEYTLEVTQNGTTSSTVVDVVVGADALDRVSEADPFDNSTVVNFRDYTGADSINPMQDENGSYNYYHWTGSGDYNGTWNGAGVSLNKNDHKVYVPVTITEDGKFDFAFYGVNNGSSAAAYIFDAEILNADGEAVGTYEIKEVPGYVGSKLYYTFAEGVELPAGEYTVGVSKRGSTATTLVSILYAQAHVCEFVNDVYTEDAHPHAMYGTCTCGEVGLVGYAAVVDCDECLVVDADPTTDAYYTASTKLNTTANTSADSVNGENSGDTYYKMEANEDGSNIGGIRVNGDFEFQFNVPVLYAGTYDLVVVADHFVSSTDKISVEPVIVTFNGAEYVVAPEADARGVYYYKLAFDLPLEAGTYAASVKRMVEEEGMVRASYIHSVILEADTAEDVPAYDPNAAITVDSPFDGYYLTNSVDLRNNSGLNASAGSTTWYGYAAHEPNCTVGGVHPQGDYVFQFPVTVGYDGIYDIAVRLDHRFKGTAVFTFNGETYTVTSANVDGAYYYILAEDVALEAGYYVGTVARLDGAQIPLTNAFILGAETREDITGVTDTNPFTDNSQYYGYGESNAHKQTDINVAAEYEEDGTTVAVRNFWSWNPGDYKTEAGVGAALGQNKDGTNKGGIMFANANYTYTLKFTPDRSGEYAFALFLAHRTDGSSLNITKWHVKVLNGETVLGSYSFTELPGQIRSTRYYKLDAGVALDAGVEYTVEVNVDAATTASTLVDFVYAAAELDDVSKELPEQFADVAPIPFKDYSASELNPMSYDNNGDTSYYYYHWAGNDYKGTLPGKTGIMLNVNDHKFYVPFTVSADGEYSIGLFTANGYGSAAAYQFAAEITDADGNVVESYTIKEVPGYEGSKLYYIVDERIDLTAGDYMFAISKLGTTKTTLVDLYIADAPCQHVPGAEATCTEDQTCTLCGEVLVEALGHTYAAGTRTDEAHPHAIYNVCVCGEEQATGEFAKVDSCQICNPIATKPEGTVHYGTPVIDGEMDDIYADTLTIVYDGNLDMNTFKDLGWADAKATVYAMYDEQYVYFYAVVEDDDVYMADASYYEKYNPYGIDAIEFRLNFGGEANQANQFKITLDAYGVQAFNLWADRYPYTTIDTYATSITDNGYVLELAVPHTVEGTDNTNLLEVGKLGFNMWLVDLYTLGSTAPVHGTDFYMYGLNYGNGNGVVEYYDLGAKEGEHVCDFTYATETDAEHPHAVYGVCECGEKQLQAESSDVADCLVCHPFAMSGASMTLGNELSLSFFFEVAKIPAGEECYVVVTKEYADGRADVTRTFTPDTWQKLGSSLYYVSFNGIAAKEMSDKMYVQVFNSQGQAISEVWDDSIQDYLMRKFDSFNQYQKTWAVDCLNYGAASQTQFGYDTENLANSKLTAEQQALATQSITMTDKSDMGDKGVGASLKLESSIELVVFFKGITDKTGMYAEISFTNYKGDAKSATVAAEDFMALGSFTGVSVTTMVAADVSQDITVTMYNADGSVYGVIVDSVESYAARKSAESPLFEAVMKFGVAARTMFENQ